MTYPYRYLVVLFCAVFRDKPCRYIAPAVQDAPNINVLGLLDVENQIRMPLELNASQIGNAKFVCVAGRTRRRMIRDQGIGVSEIIDKAESNLRVGLAKAMIDSFINVLVRSFSRNNRLCRHF